MEEELLAERQKAAADLGDISEEQILKTVREYRSGRKKPAGDHRRCPDKNENGLEASSTRTWNPQQLTSTSLEGLNEWTHRMRCFGPRSCVMSRTRQQPKGV